MKYIIAIVVTIALLSGCATLTAREKKRIDVLSCIKMIKEQDDNSGISDIYEVCRQLYGISKVVDRTK